VPVRGDVLYRLEHPLLGLVVKVPRHDAPKRV
jgi:hypothetical protein